MNASLRKQIYVNMDARPTEELLEMWQTNDRVEWSDEAFEAIREVLRNRGVELPTQNEPVFKHEVEPELDTEGLTEQELKIIDDENPPEFYDPFQAIRLGKWLNIAAFASIILAAVSVMMEYRATHNIVQSYFSPSATAEIVVLVLTVLILIVGVCVQILMTYFPLKALAHILRILMQMEYNSRKPVAAQPVTEN